LGTDTIQRRGRGGRQKPYQGPGGPAKERKKEKAHHTILPGNPFAERPEQMCRKVECKQSKKKSKKSKQHKFCVRRDNWLSKKKGRKTGAKALRKGSGQ